MSEESESGGAKAEGSTASMRPRRKAKVIALSLGQALAQSIGLLTAMVMARLLIKEDFAAYRQTLLTYTSIAPLLSLGISEGLYYFLPVERERVRGRILDAFIVLGISGLVMALFIGCGGNQLLARQFSNPKVAEMLLWMIPYSLISPAVSVVAPGLVIRDRALTASVFGVLRQFSIGMAVIVPLLLWKNAEAPLIGNVCASVLLGLVGIWLLLRATPQYGARPQGAAVCELLAYSVPIGLATILESLLRSSDKLIVGFLRPPEEFAVYSVGAMEIPLIGILTGSITMVFMGEIRRAVQREDLAEAVRLFHLTARKTSYLLLPVMLFLLVMAEAVVTALYGEAYREAAMPLRIYLLLVPLRTVMLGSLILPLGGNRFTLRRAIVGFLLNLLLTIVMVRWLGSWGAAFATVITMYLWVMPTSLCYIEKRTNRQLGELLPLGHYVRVLLHSLPAIMPIAVVTWSFSRYSPWVSLAVASVIFGVYFGWYWNHMVFHLSFKAILSSFRR